MDAITFLDAVLPRQGQRVVVGISQGRAFQRSFATNAAALEQATSFDGQGFDAYVAIGGYGPTVDERGHLRRTASNALWHRSLRIDLDVGADAEKYDTKDAALAGLVDFLNATHLPRPLVVDSGGGLHVYWPLDRDIELEAWRPLALRLKDACALHRLKADPTATADAARILRVPGTTNTKPHLGGAKVAVLNDNVAPIDPAVLDARLPGAPVPDALPASLGPVPASVGRAAASPLQMPQGQAYDLGRTIRECGVLADMVAQQGNGYDNNQWYLALNAVQASMHTPEQKRAIALEMSKGWQKDGRAFDINDFNRTWLRTTNGHPFSCRTMATSGGRASSICAQCPYANDNLPSVGITGYNGFVSKRHAPASAPPQVAAAAFTGASVSAAAPSTGVFTFLPDGTAIISPGTVEWGKWTIDDRHRPCRTVVDTPKTKDAAPTYKAVPFLGIYTLLSAARSGNRVVLTLGAGADGTITLDLPFDSLHPQQQQRILGTAGIYLNADQRKQWEDFMSSFLQALQTARMANAGFDRGGWTKDYTGFVLGERIYRKNESPAPNAVPPTSLNRHFDTAGDEATWRRAFDVVLASGPERQMLLALSIAAPLMPFTNLEGAFLNTVSASGTGKTTTGRMAQSLWGNPHKLGFHLSDTNNARIRALGQHGSLPAVFDEFTVMEGDDLLSHILEVTQGREKRRLTSGADYQGETADWNLIVFASANRSIVDRLLNNDSTDSGGLARVLEITMPPLPPSSNIDAGIIAAATGHYGFLGPRIAQAFVDVGADRWRELVTQEIAKLSTIVGNPGENRFRIALAVLAGLGAVIGQKLGLAFDPAAVRATVQRSIEAMRTTVSEQRREPMSFVADYLVRFESDFLIFCPGQQPRQAGTHARPVTGESHRLPDGSMLVEIRESDLRKFVLAERGQWSAVKAALASTPGVHVRSYHFRRAPGYSAVYSRCFSIPSTVFGMPALALVPPATP